MMNMSQRHKPHQDEKISAQGRPFIFNDRRDNPHNTGQAAAVPKPTLYMLSLNTPATYKSNLKVKTKQYMQSPGKSKRLSK